MPPEYPSKPVSYLMRHKFGSGVDAFICRDPVDEQEEQLRKEVWAYCIALKSLNDEDLRIRVWQQ